MKTPQFLYKYGASYYIDGGDEGTSQIFSVSTGLTPKQITAASETSLFGVRPKDIIESYITRPSGADEVVGIVNRKLILPTKLNLSTNALTEVKIKTCKACAGFGHVFTPGVATTETGRDMTIKFIGGNTITAVGSGASFTAADIGAKLVAPSIFNAYISEMDEDAIRKVCKDLKVKADKTMGRGKLIDEIFGEKCEKNIVQPTFVTDYPIEMSPLAKKHRSKIDIEIEFFDERLTSFEARQLDEDSEMIDDVAAKIILDSWLNNEHS